MDGGDGLVEEKRAEAGEFFHGVGGVALEGGGACDGCAGRNGGGYLTGGGFGGVDDGGLGVEKAEGGGDFVGDEGVVGAAEQHSAGRSIDGAHFVESFAEIDVQNVARDGVVGPALFDERDEERAGFFVGL